MANKKLFSEIEKTLKKCNEGILNFDDIYERIYDEDATQNQREKQEGELKKEIKRLQKYRESIKQWTNNDVIKDKSALKAMRRKIEERMESFKRCERDTKRKEYSKEALKRAISEQSQPKSPELSSQQIESKEWFEEQMEILDEQNEDLESQLERLGRGKKGKRKNMDEIQKANDRMDRNKWHLSKLKSCLEKVINGRVDPLLYKDIADDVEYYVNDAMDDENYQPYNEMYEIIEEYEHESDSDDQIEINDTNAMSKDNNDKYDNEDNDDDDDDDNDNKAAKAPPPSSKTIKREKAKKRKSKTKKGSSSSSSKSSPLSSASIPETTYNQRQSNMNEQLLQEPLPVNRTKIKSIKAKPKAKPKNLTKIKPPKQQRSKPPKISQPEPQLQTKHNPPPNIPHPKIQNLSKPPMTTTTQSTFRSPPHHSPTHNVPQSSPRNLLPPFSRTLTEKEQSILDIINDGYSKRPQPLDTHEPSLYKPENPYRAPPFFPKERRKLFDGPNVFGLMDLDTLFFIFYYQSGSYQQFMAAKELKIRGWSFNKRYSAWFQRHYKSPDDDEDKLKQSKEEKSKSIKSLKGKGQHIIVDNKYERGTYIFFDRNQSWQMRMRENFKFDYQYLEDDKAVNVDDKLDWNKLATYGNGCGLIYGEQKQLMRYHQQQQQLQKRHNAQSSSSSSQMSGNYPTRPPSLSSQMPQHGRFRPPIHHRQQYQSQSRR